jgi:hypothetical protein
MGQCAWTMPAMEKDGESECKDQHRRESPVGIDQMRDVSLGRVNSGRQTIEMKPIDDGVSSLDEKAKAIRGVTGWVLLKGDRLRGSASEKYAEGQHQREDDRGDEHVNDPQWYATCVCLVSIQRYRDEIDIRCKTKKEREENEQRIETKRKEIHRKRKQQ